MRNASKMPADVEGLSKERERLIRVMSNVGIPIVKGRLLAKLLIVEAKLEDLGRMKK